MDNSFDRFMEDSAELSPSPSAIGKNKSGASGLGRYSNRARFGSGGAVPSSAPGLRRVADEDDSISFDMSDMDSSIASSPSSIASPMTTGVKLGVKPSGVTGSGLTAAGFGTAAPTVGSRFGTGAGSRFGKMPSIKPIIKTTTAAPADSQTSNAGNLNPAANDSSDMSPSSKFKSSSLGTANVILDAPPVVELESNAKSPEHRSPPRSKQMSDSNEDASKSFGEGIPHSVASDAMLSIVNSSSLDTDSETEEQEKRAFFNELEKRSPPEERVAPGGSRKGNGSANNPGSEEEYSASFEGSSVEDLMVGEESRDDDADSSHIVRNQNSAPNVDVNPQPSISTRPIPLSPMQFGVERRQRQEESEGPKEGHLESDATLEESTFQNLDSQQADASNGLVPATSHTTSSSVKEGFKVPTISTKRNDGADESMDATDLVLQSAEFKQGQLKPNVASVSERESVHHNPEFVDKSPSTGQGKSSYNKTVMSPNLPKPESTQMQTEDIAFDNGLTPPRRLSTSRGGTPVQGAPAMPTFSNEETLGGPSPHLPPRATPPPRLMTQEEDVPTPASSNSPVESRVISGRHKGFNDDESDKDSERASLLESAGASVQQQLNKSYGSQNTSISHKQIVYRDVTSKTDGLHGQGPTKVISRVASSLATLPSETAVFDDVQPLRSSGLSKEQAQSIQELTKEKWQREAQGAQLKEQLHKQRAVLEAQMREYEKQAIEARTRLRQEEGRYGSAERRIVTLENRLAEYKAEVDRLLPANHKLLAENMRLTLHSPGKQAAQGDGITDDAGEGVPAADPLLEKLLDAYKSEVETLSNQVKQLKGTGEKQFLEIEEIKNDRDVLRRELDALRAQQDPSLMGVTSSSLGEEVLRKRLVSLQGESRKERMNWQEREADMAKEIGSLRNKLQDLKQEAKMTNVGEISRSLKSSELRVQELEAENEKYLDKIKDLNERLEFFAENQERIDARDGELGELRAKLGEAEEAVTAARKQVKEAKANANLRPGEAKRLREQIKDLQAKLKTQKGDPVAELLRANKPSVEESEIVQDLSMQLMKSKKALEAKEEEIQRKILSFRQETEQTRMQHERQVSALQKQLQDKRTQQGMRELSRKEKDAQLNDIRLFYQKKVKILEDRLADAKDLLEKERASRARSVKKSARAASAPKTKRPQTSVPTAGGSRQVGMATRISSEASRSIKQKAPHSGQEDKSTVDLQAPMSPPSEMSAGRSKSAQPKKTPSQEEKIAARAESDARLAAKFRQLEQEIQRRKEQGSPSSPSRVRRGQPMRAAVTDPSDISKRALPKETKLQLEEGTVTAARKLNLGSEMPEENSAEENIVREVAKASDSVDETSDCSASMSSWEGGDPMEVGKQKLKEMAASYERKMHNLFGKAEQVAKARRHRGTNALQQPQETDITDTVENVPHRQIAEQDGDNQPDSNAVGNQPNGHTVQETRPAVQADSDGKSFFDVLMQRFDKLESQLDERSVKPAPTSVPQVWQQPRNNSAAALEAISNLEQRLREVEQRQIQAKTFSESGHAGVPPLTVRAQATYQDSANKALEMSALRKELDGLLDTLGDLQRREGSSAR